jgi:hypothetical protein
LGWVGTLAYRHLHSKEKPKIRKDKVKKARHAIKNKKYAMSMLLAKCLFRFQKQKNLKAYRISHFLLEVRKQGFV